jgi:hypothetical protein
LFAGCFSASIVILRSADVNGGEIPGRNRIRGAAAAAGNFYLAKSKSSSDEVFGIHACQLSICVSPQIEIVCSEIVRPRGEQMNRMASPSRGLSRSPISEFIFRRWRASAARPIPGQRDPHPPPVGHFFLAKFTAPATAGARAIAPPS